MKKPCCDRAYITYPYLNDIVCINCGTFRVKLPERTIKIKAKKKKKVEKDIESY